MAAIKINKANNKGLEGESRKTLRCTLVRNKQTWMVKKNKEAAIAVATAIVFCCFFLPIISSSDVKRHLDGFEILSKYGRCVGKN